MSAMLRTPTPPGYASWLRRSWHRCVGYHGPWRLLRMIGYVIMIIRTGVVGLRGRATRGLEDADPARGVRR
jgi:hypothetical protein